MRTHEVAERAGVNTQTMRYYERRGVLSEPPRYRDYPAAAVEVLRRMRDSVAALVATCERPPADRSRPLLAALHSDTPITRRTG